MDNSGYVGRSTESEILRKLISLNCVVSVSFGSHNPYDLVLDVNGVLYRVECRTGRYRDGVILFNTLSKTTRNGKRIEVPSVADLFSVYCKETENVYLVPGNKFKTEGRLRIAPPKKHDPNIKWARDYTVEKFLGL